MARENQQPTQERSRREPSRLQRCLPNRCLLFFFFCSLLTLHCSCCHIIELCAVPQVYSSILQKPFRYGADLNPPSLELLTVCALKCWKLNIYWDLLPFKRVGIKYKFKKLHKVNNGTIIMIKWKKNELKYRKSKYLFKWCLLRRIKATRRFYREEICI